MIAFQNKKHLKTLLILCGFFISQLTYAQTEIVTICKGASVTLSNLEDPSPGFPGAGGQFGCNSISRRIAPNDASVVRSSGGFILSPNTTTTYTITSYTGPAFAGDGCNRGPELIQTFEVKVENCAIDSPGDIILCTGQSAILGNLAPPAIGPQPPQGLFVCDSYIRRIEPNDANVTKLGSAFYVSPAATTTYTVTSFYAPVEPGDNCVPGPEFTETIKVQPSKYRF